MSDDFTPDTEQVRAHYVFNQSDVWDAERKLAFDRWLQTVKAEVWTEAQRTVYNSYEVTGIGSKFRPVRNPYKN